MTEAPKILPKKKERKIIKETTFKFDVEKIKNNLVYQSKRGSNRPDKRYDENCEGLRLFIYSSLNKVWYLQISRNVQSPHSFLVGFGSFDNEKKDKKYFMLDANCP